MSLSVLLYGDFQSDRLAGSYQRAFEQLGHRVTRFDVRDMKPKLTPWIRGRVGHRLTMRSLPLRRVGSAHWNAHFCSTARDLRTDLVLILNGEFLMPETLRQVREIGSKVFIFHADNPFSPHYANRPETLPSALESDCYFIWSLSLRDKLKRIGVRRVEYLPFAWDPDVFPYSGSATDRRHEVVFVGGWDDDRERFLGRIALTCDLKIWGPPYWGERTRPNSPLRGCWQGHALTGRQAAQTLAESRVALNIVRQQNLPDGVIMRTFEVPGCGGFALSTRTQGAVDIFPEGETGAYFEDVDECIQQIEHFLAHPAERDRMAERAHGVVSSTHRYLDRARYVVDTYEGLS
jgi:Glycosyl transferases group 1